MIRNKYKIHSLNPICDQRGRLMELCRIDWRIRNGKPIKQTYLTTAYPGVVKAWHLHRKQTDFMVVVSGMMMIGLYDEETEESRCIFTGELNPCIIRINPELWHGFKNIGTTEAMVINCPDRLYDYDEPDEFRAEYDTFKSFDWTRKNG